MVTRLSRRILLAVLAACSLIAAACEKVPLLAPTGSTITLTASTTALPVNGAAQLIAQVIEASGTPPHNGTHVIFTTSLGTIEPTETETDINGRAVVTFRAGNANGTATITASSGAASVSGVNAVKIAVGTAAVGRVVVAANPTVLAALGGSATITAAVYDINGNPLPAAPVSFSTTAGTLDLAVANTDGSGVAFATLRTSTAATVTASVGATGGSSTPTPPANGGTTPTPPPASSGQASGSVTVNVAGAPTLVITVPTTPPSAGLPASFTFAVTAATANASPIRNVTVSWGDGQIQDLGAITGSNVVFHTYGSPGAYTITATVVDSFGTTVPVSSSVVVNPKAQPVVTLTGPTTTPTAGTDTLFTGSVAPAANTGAVISSVVMDYGDGSIQSLGAITGTAIALHHVYVEGGRTYTATLTATDSNGGVGKSATSVFVQTATPLTVSLSASQVPSGTNTTVTFTATVLGLGNAVVSNYHWVFGGTNGTADTSSNTQTRVYPNSGVPITVSVTITTSDNRTATGTTVIQP